MSIEIYWDDLTPEKQEEIIETFGELQLRCASHCCHLTGTGAGAVRSTDVV